MAKNTKETNGGAGAKAVVAVGVGMLAALSAGAYYLYGTKEGAKKRIKMRGWMLKAKGEMMDKMESMKEMNEETYNNLIQTVMKKYEAVKNIDPKEVQELTSDLKKHWKNIKRHIDAAKKPVAKKKAK
jgi:hypothetical protein